MMMAINEEINDELVHKRAGDRRGVCKAKRPSGECRMEDVK